MLSIEVKHAKINRIMTHLVICLVSLTAVCGMVLIGSQHSVFASTTALDSTTVFVPANCTLSASGNSTYNRTVDSGSVTEITANTITTSCNDAAGYAIYAVGYSGDSYSGNNTDLVASIGSTYNIKTDGTGSNWKMKLTAGTNATVVSGYQSYHNIPASFDKVASYTTDTTSGTVTPSYQVTVSATQPAGTYTGKVKYVLVHPNTMVAGSYNIAYNANGGTGTMTGSTGLYNFEEFTMPASTFTAPSGYKFAGWCTTNTAGSYACDGTSYAVGDKVTGLASAGSTATLYAYWEEKIYMQDLTLANCSADGMTVYDRRDESDYIVRKIGDACWMTQNLRITKSTGQEDWIISSTDSNFSTRSTWNVHVNDLTSGNTYTEARSHVADADSVTAAKNAGYDTTLDGKTVTAEILGVWYNYCAASAGTVCAETKTDASEDICPANWHLPIYNTDTTNYPIGNIYSMTGSPTAVGTNNASLFNPVYGGRYNGGTLLYAGTYGFWWSATAYNTSGQYYLRYYYGSLSTYNSTKRDGNYIRCVRTS